MTSARHWLVLGAVLFAACALSSAEAEPKAEAEAAPEAKAEYDSDVSSRSTSRFGNSRSLNLGLTRDDGYQSGTNHLGVNSRLGSTGYQSDQFGTNRFGGNNLLGTSQFGTSGLRNSQFGTNHFGTGGQGTSQFGTSGLGTRGQYGTSGLGTSQFGTTGFGTRGQYGTSGLGTSQFGTNHFGTGGGLANSRFGASGLTSNRFGTNQFGTNQFGTTGLGTNQFGTTGYGTNQFGTTGLGLRTNQFGNSGYGSNQFGANRFGSNQFNRNNLQSGLATEGGILTHRSENDGSGLYSFAYETENGISHQETGQPQGAGSYGVQGSYSYTSPEGVPVTVKYIADENGFQVDSPNVPAIPEHSQRQILAAEELRRQGLVDNYGNVLNDQNQFQTSNLHNLVSQNRNSLGSSGSYAGSSNFGGAGGFNRFNNQGRFGSGNFLGTTVVRRPLLLNGQDQASIAALNRHTLQTYGRDDTRGSLFLDDQRLLNDNRYLSGGLYGHNNFGRFGQNYDLNQGGYSNLGSDSDRDFVRIVENLDQRLRAGDSRRFSSRGGRSGSQLGEYTSQGFLSPVFQQQTASRLAIQEGGHSRQPFGRLLSFRQRDDDDLSSHSDLYNASDLNTGVGGSVASHIYKS